ncbi:MAG: phosphoribosyltransferase family protein [Candidatus Azambacteria bacterium]|nr:phosphoribosyltransferase family protein [Candidatus Azambacteria bacterium]
MKNNLVQFVLDVLFPSFCVGCNTEGSVLCTTCRSAIVIQRVPTRPSGKSLLSVLYAATEYREQKTVSLLIAALKYHGVKHAAVHCADILTTHLLHTGFTPRNDHLVVAVPLHKKRLRERGFNQAELIAKNIAAQYKIPYAPRALTRREHTPPQTEVHERAKRLENVKGAFVCYNVKTVRGKSIILIDDVTTTGATFEACAHALKAAGAKKITACAIAK